MDSCSRRGTSDALSVGRRQISRMCWTFQTRTSLSQTSSFSVTTKFGLSREKFDVWPRRICFLWTWRYTMFNSIPIILFLLTNKIVHWRFITSKLQCEHKTKDCAPLGGFQRTSTPLGCFYPGKGHGYSHVWTIYTLYVPPQTWTAGSQAISAENGKKLFPNFGLESSTVLNGTTAV